MIQYDYINGIFKIIEEPNITFDATHKQEVFIYDPINFLEFIKNIEMNTKILTGNNVKLVAEYRVTLDHINFTKWENLEGVTINQGAFNAFKKYIMYIRFTLVGTGSIVLNSFALNGRIHRAIESGEETFVVDGDREVLIKPPFKYKVFKIKSVEIISSNNSNLDIYFRYSQTYGRTVSEWERLTVENITTININPIKFFQIEYLVKSINGSPVTIHDINLIGEMQNVTKDYYKTNLYGIRENCNCIKLGLLNNSLSKALYHDGLGFGYDIDGNYVLNTNTGTGEDIKIGDIIEEKYYCSEDGNTPSDDYIDISNSGRLNLASETDLDLKTVEDLNTDAVLSNGHLVIYYHTDVDGNGIDFVTNEFQLHHYICHDEMIVTVDDNQFPDNQTSNSMFNIEYLDTFMVEIPKKLFKQKFGVERKPNTKDVLFFCKTNRTYEVETSYAPRTFNNASIKYRLTLIPWSNSQNVEGVNDVIKKEHIDMLKNNATIGELFGEYINDDINSVTKKDQLLPLSIDNVRKKVSCSIDDEKIYNSDILISDSHYDLGASENEVAVEYLPIGRIIPVSTNISYTSWFNYVDYKTKNNTLNLFTYYDDETDSGFKLNIINKNRLVITYNEQVYEISLGMVLDNHVWYSCIINIDSRNLKIEAFIYKRNISFEDDVAPNSKLLKIFDRKIDMNYNEDMLLSDDLTPKIKTSEAKMTNIRLFKGLIPLKEHNKILNENIIREDSDKLLIGDNANIIMTTTRYDQTGVIKRQKKL